MSGTVHMPDAQTAGGVQAQSAQVQSSPAAGQHAPSPHTSGPQSPGQSQVVSPIEQHASPQSSTPRQSTEHVHSVSGATQSPSPQSDAQLGGALITSQNSVAAHMQSAMQLSQFSAGVLSQFPSPQPTQAPV
jgi:hypothetical protein